MKSTCFNFIFHKKVFFTPPACDTTGNDAHHHACVLRHVNRKPNTTSMMTATARPMALAPSTIANARTATTTATARCAAVPSSRRTPHAALLFTSSSRVLTRGAHPRRRRGVGVVTAGLKDFDKDLAKVNPSQMSDALQGDDREARQQAVIGVGGCVAAAVMTWSLVTLKNTGCGLPPGPGGAFGAAEGVSYLYVTGLVAWSAVKKVNTGSGLPEGPGGVLGLAEGLAYLCALGGLAAGALGVCASHSSLLNRHDFKPRRIRLFLSLT